MSRILACVIAGLTLISLPPVGSAQTYTPYADLGPKMLDAEADHPLIARRHDLGLSVQNRNIWAICITDNVDAQEDEPEFKYISSMHGDEIVGVEMCLNLIDLLTDDYSVDPRVTSIVDNVEIWIVPLMNPDGYDRSPRSRYNANGVNLNRDFPDPYTSPDPSPAGREPETAAIMNWSAGRSFTLAANFHGGALVVNYPFDTNPSGASVYTASPDDDMFIWISEEYSRHNPPMWNSPSFYHGITNGADWYTINGGMQDWSYRYTGCNEVTIEISNNKGPPPSQLPTFWNENRESMLGYLETCLIGVRGIVTDAASGAPVAATVSVTGRDHQVYTDPDVGDYHRMLMPGVYELLVRAEAYDTQRSFISVAPGPAARVDVQLGPPPAITFPNGGEELIAGVPTDVTWEIGAPDARSHVQYSDNYGDLSVATDDFESGTLGSGYSTGGDADWYASSGTSHQGNWSARAGDIDDGQDSWLTRTAEGGELTFWHRVSSESNYDFFNFYVDGEQLLHVSGSTGWAEFATDLTAGTHQLKWEYTKDGSVSSGSDTVWIDDLEITLDGTVWSDIIAVTAPGEMSALWIPPSVGDDYRVRVRHYYGSSAVGEWDESDAVFSVLEGFAGGDYDDDGDVDLADFGAFQRCYGADSTGPCGDAFEFVVDGVIDIADFPGFESRLTGP